MSVADGRDARSAMARARRPFSGCGAAREDGAQRVEQHEPGRRGGVAVEARVGDLRRESREGIQIVHRAQRGAAALSGRRHPAAARGRPGARNCP